MSLPILNAVAEEMRRLALAGASVAPGDFRLKKLLPQLEQAGAKAPVFAKVHDAAKAVVESKDAAGPLLDLTTLVNAIRYTQGVTALAGELKPIATTDLGLAPKQSSARTLKPLLEALTTTGGGRLEIVKEAIEQNRFNDLRLVSPAIAGLDDVYGEIADILADQVVPKYGPAIVPLVKAKLDIKGKASNARRLRVLHRLDPKGTRELVLQALDDGAKDVKIAATECLGAEDLPLLLEQVKAKAGDVRSAAYQALGRIDRPEAIAALVQSLNPKQLMDSYHGFRLTKSATLIDALHAAARAAFMQLTTCKDKKSIDQHGPHFELLIRLMTCHEDTATVKELGNYLDQLSVIEGWNGASFSGSHVAKSLTFDFENGTPSMQEKLAGMHRELSAEYLSDCADAGVKCWPPAKFFDEFSPYFTMDAKKLKITEKDLKSRHEAVIGGLIMVEDRQTGFDPRWYDLAIRTNHFRLLYFTIKPGYPKAVEWLENYFAKAKPDDHETAIDAMIIAGSPKATDALLQTLERQGKKLNHWEAFSLLRLVAKLPKASLPVVEAAIPRIPEKLRDQYVKEIESLRAS